MASAITGRASSKRAGANVMAEFWTTEQVADHLGISVDEVYRTRRNNEYPGNIGKRQGRRLRFRSDLVEAGPQEPETTENVLEAILWALGGIERKLGAVADKQWQITVDATRPEGADYDYGLELRKVEALERIADLLENPPEGSSVRSSHE